MGGGLDFKPVIILCELEMLINISAFPYYLLHFCLTGTLYHTHFIPLLIRNYCVPKVLDRTGKKLSYLFLFIK